MHGTRHLHRLRVTRSIISPRNRLNRPLSTSVFTDGQSCASTLTPTPTPTTTASYPSLSSVSPRGRRPLSSTVTCHGPAPSDLIDLKSLEEESHHRSARDWANGFKLEDLPKGSWSVTYSRSSGPGGQHVNKTNSKATVRFPIHPAIGTCLPRYLLPGLQASPHYTSSPPSLLISSSTSRSAPQNLSAALSILHSTLLSCARAPIRGETSQAQRERVMGLVAKDKARKRVTKDKLKSNKAWRRGD